MSGKSDTNRRIAKNTLALYARMLFSMAVTLYTSRVVLNTLGVEDYGLYNVVGGFVAMFSFFNSAMASATQRYLNFELGRGDAARLHRVFCTSMNIHALISVVVLLLSETVGLWFVYTHLTIPPDRFEAALWVYQASILASVVMVMSIPYNAAIIAHERMGAFAYISVLEVVLKLLIVYLLVVGDVDKLKLYAVLMLLVQVLIRVIYGRYSGRHFPETHYRLMWDAPLFKEMTGFAGWSLFGNIAAVAFTQGLNVLLNMFFGPAVNAARGIAVQVQNAIKGFCTNFQTALNPQITKSYAAGEMDYMYRLVCRGARFSFFLLFIFTVPIVCEADYILRLWLKIVPEHAPVFLRLTLFGALMTLLGTSMLTAVSATGKIRRYQLWVTIVGCWVFPLTWVAFLVGFPASATYVIYIIIYFLLVFVRLYIAKDLLNFPVKLYVTDVMLRVTVVSAVSFVLPLLLIRNMDEGFLRFCAICVVSVAATLLTVLLFGLEGSERRKILAKANKIILPNKKD